MPTTRYSGSTRYSPETFPTYPGGSAAAASDAGFGNTFGTATAAPVDPNEAQFRALRAGTAVDPTPRTADPFAGFGGTIPPGFGANGLVASPGRPFSYADFFGAGPGFSGYGGLGQFLGNIPGLSPFALMGADWGRAQRANQYYQQMGALERLGLAPRGFAQGLAQQGALNALSVLNGPFGMFGGGFPGGGGYGSPFGPSTPGYMPPQEDIYARARRTGGEVIVPFSGPPFIHYPQEQSFVPNDQADWYRQNLASSLTDPRRSVRTR